MSWKWIGNMIRAKSDLNKNANKGLSADEIAALLGGRPHAWLMRAGVKGKAYSEITAIDWDILSVENGEIQIRNGLSGEIRPSPYNFPLWDCDRHKLHGQWVEYDSQVFSLDNPAYALSLLHLTASRVKKIEDAMDL